MPVLKFETKVVDGRPNISFGSEQQRVAQRKPDYKIKNQKYPLRNNGNHQLPNDNQTKNSKKSPYETELFSHKKPNEIKKISQQIDRNSANSTPEVFINNKINNVNNYRKTGKQPVIKESLFNFLKNDKETDKIPRRNSDNTDKNIKERKESKRASLSEEDIDEIMKQVVLENKNLLSEEQLVDILAKLYLDAKIGKKQKSVSQETQKKIVNKTEKSEERKIDKQEEYRQIDVNHQVSQENIQKLNNNLPAITELTAIQRKQIQWEKERKEMAEIVAYNPWGKPGCGAPTKNSIEIPKSEFNHQQKEVKSIQNTINKPIENQGNYFSNHENISQTELKRQQWLTELNEQVAENERRKMLEKNTENPLGNYQIKVNPTENNSITHGRGKGLADLSQMSSEEMIQKRNKQLEQQEAIRRQIEEKEFQKKIERERKARLDQEEESRIMIEKQKLDTQYLSETARVKQKDDESGKRLAQQRLQLEAAERAALMDKKLKRLQRLELAGHDTRQLRAGFIAEQMSGRLGDSFELRSDNSLKQLNFEKGHDQFQTDRSPRSYVRLPVTEDQSVQTEDFNYRGYRTREIDDYEYYPDHSSHRNRLIETPKQMKYNKSATETTNRKHLKINIEKRSSSAASVKSQITKKIKKPEPIEKRKPWGVKKISKKYIPQSKRDPFYSTYQEARETHKQERVNKILAQVKANIDRIPDIDPNNYRSNQKHKKIDTHRISDHDKENYEVNHDTYELKNNSYADDDDDRAHGQVIYKDTYRQSNKPNQSHRHVPIPQDIRKSPELANNWWNDPNHEIVRTTDILNPAVADQVLPITRENTGRERARQGYYKGLNPAQYGEPMKSTQEAYHSHHTESNKRDPFYQTPTHPTQRQNTILKQLSDIREGLLMKQKEIETSLSINADI